MIISKASSLTTLPISSEDEDADENIFVELLEAVSRHISLNGRAED